MQEIEINSHRYRIGKLGAIQQFHLSRKLAPIIPKLAPVIGIGRAFKEHQLGMDDLEEVAKAAEPLLGGLSAMSIEDSEFIIDLCMSVVTRHQEHPSTWVQTWNPQAKRAQFDDIDMVVMLRLTIAVIRANLGTFMPELIAKADAAKGSEAKPA